MHIILLTILLLNCFVATKASLYKELVSKNVATGRFRRSSGEPETTTTTPQPSPTGVVVDGVFRKDRDVNEVEFLVHCEGDKCTKVDSFDIATKGGGLRCIDKNLFISFGAYQNNFSTFNDEMTGYIGQGKSVLITNQQERSSICLRIKRFFFLFKIK
jgi:hypothetical protein